MRCSDVDIAVKAVKVRCEAGQVCVRLADEREIRFPATGNRRLRRATPDQVARIEIICGGTGLHWPDLDEDLSVAGILEGRIGG